MRIGTFVLVMVSLLATACGKDEGEIFEPPPPQLPNGVFAAVVDGAEYEPTSATVSAVGDVLTITTTDGVQSFTFTLNGPGFGNFRILSNTTHTATFTGAGNQMWTALGSVGSGLVTINTRTSSRVQGTFSLILAPVTSSGATNNKEVASGIFNLTY